MNQIGQAYDELTERFVEWARTRPDVRAAIVVGSRARNDRSADEWSDLDIVMFVTDPEPYLTSADWLKTMGDVQITFVEPTAGVERERRALFDGGLDVDFAVIPCTKLELMIEHGIPPRVAEVVRRGMRVLLDRDGLVAGLAPSDTEPTAQVSPGPQEFLEAVNDFWYHAVLTAKKLKRGELWYAKACADSYMKRLLLKMIEWHARAINVKQCDIWHDGRFMEQWADPRVMEGLRGAFAHYDWEDTRCALLVTMQLFRWLAKETAECLAYPYPTSGDDYATASVSALLSPAIEADTCDEP